MVDVPTGELRQLTDWRGDEAIPVFSRDGESIYFISQRSGNLGIWRMPLSPGPEAAERVTGDCFCPVFEESWDGSRLYYNDKATGDFFKLPLRDGAQEPRRIVSAANATHYAFRVARSGLYFVRKAKLPHDDSIDGPSGSGVLWRYDVRSGRRTALFSVSGYLSSVTPDESAVLLVDGAPATSDLRMLKARASCEVQAESKPAGGHSR